MKNIILLALSSVFFLASTAFSQVQTDVVEYKHGNTALEGYVSYDKSLKGPRPGILVVHEWYGVNDYVKKRAQQLAQLGYVAFVVDMYGKGIHPTTPQECGIQAGKYRNDRPLMRARVKAALDELKKNKMVDPKKIAAIGYCFGGSVVLELARSGADIAGVVSFHGGLDTPTPEDAKNIKAKVLVCHGGDDPHITMEAVTAFHDEMSNAKVDYQVIIYGGAVHSFTNPDAGNDPSKGAAYSPSVDKRSREAMRQFFNEIFK
ncbi:MAG: dienelactone hydrolase [candidate division Zixibacteria bacterium RBG-1]|nr:MAG: dienelactone hydrolase [candidate division Zixibacteria bacterium RBG-1]OGC83188.1 MAG: dienelactone hydrolase [candidate division Zixibacteria bacterium RBG_19FT_COMBO_42_43]